MRTKEHALGAYYKCTLITGFWLIGDCWSFTAIPCLWGFGKRFWGGSRQDSSGRGSTGQAKSCHFHRDGL